MLLGSQATTLTEAVERDRARHLLVLACVRSWPPLPSPWTSHRCGGATGLPKLQCVSHCEACGQGVRSVMHATGSALTVGALKTPGLCGGSTEDENACHEMLALIANCGCAPLPAAVKGRPERPLHHQIILVDRDQSERPQRKAVSFSRGGNLGTHKAEAKVSVF